MDDVKPVLPLRRSARWTSAAVTTSAQSGSPASADVRLATKKRARKSAQGSTTTVKIEAISGEADFDPPARKSKAAKSKVSTCHVKEEAATERAGTNNTANLAENIVRQIASSNFVDPAGCSAPLYRQEPQIALSSYVDHGLAGHHYHESPPDHYLSSTNHPTTPGRAGISAPIAGPSTQLVSIKEETPAQDITGKAPAPGKSLKAKKVAKVEQEEKRPGRYRERCPQNTRDRVGRVMCQRMYMVDREKVPAVPNTETFKVLGSTGNVYSIVIGASPTCNCPDCMKGNVPCKHIIFVFLKVLKVPEQSNLWYQKGLLTGELEKIFAASPKAVAGASAPDHVRKAYLKATGGTVDEEEDKSEAGASGFTLNRKIDSLGEDCPVCYEEMSEKDDQKGKLVYDEVPGGCGKPLHKDCFKMWAQTARTKGDAVTCVWCRSLWPDSAGGGSGKGKGQQYTALGYLNMAAEAGMSRQRDTSTYYYGPRAGERLWTAHYRYMDDY